MNMSERKRFLLSKRYALAKAGNKIDRFKASLIEERIREVYSVSDELGLLRQRDTKQEEFAKYNAFVEQTKADVQAEIEKYCEGETT